MARYVIGSIVVRNWKARLADLLVSLYSTTTDVPTDDSQWKSMGSTLTDTHGNFRIDYELDERISQAGRIPNPNLVLEVSSPDASTVTDEATPTRIALAYRKNAATAERFLIRIREGDLLSAGITPPGSTQEIDESIEKRRAREEKRARLDKESNQSIADAIANRLESNRKAEIETEAFLSTLSGASKRDRENPESSGYIPNDQSISDANIASIRRGIEENVNQTTLSGQLVIDEQNASGFKDENGDFMAAIPASELDTLLRPTGTAQVPTARLGPPLANLCQQYVPPDPCLALLEDDAQDTEPEPPSVEPEPVDDNGQQENQALTEEQIPILMNRMIRNMAPPESSSIFSVHSRAGPEEIEKGINGFSLRSGPADAPSIHDFHHLQIAFDHVWNELFSNTVTAVANDLFTKLHQQGINTADGMKAIVNGIEQYRTAPIMEAASEEVSNPPFAVVQVFEITNKEWAEIERLGYDDELEDRANEVINGPEQVEFIINKESFKTIQDSLKKYQKALEAAKEANRAAKRRGDNIIRYARQTAFSRPRFQQFHKILDDLEKELKQPHRFKIFGANRQERSMNFGLMTTYRQTWEPVSYQVGELVKSVPLAPKEVRRFTKKTTIRKKRAEKEVENNLQSRKTESTDTVRAETVIVGRASAKTNFQIGAQGGINIGIASASSSTKFSRQVGKFSQEIKKQFREAVFKAADEYKSERKAEVSVSSEEEQFAEESGEISNPNEEITVTYLFYELQRRYRISEQIHRLQAVVLVAQEVPNPSEIDDDWLIAHDWIIRRVILDDSFIPALDYLSTKVVGDEVALEELFQNVEQQRRLTDELKEELIELREDEDRRYRSLQRSVRRRGQAVEEEESSGIFEDIGDALSGDSSGSPEAMQVFEDAARDAYERSAKLSKEMKVRLEREITALNSTTDTYTKTLSEHLNRRTQIARLLVHIKQNIIYYMQAIWAHEPPDQQFMRLKNVDVPKLTGNLTYQLKPDPGAIPVPPKWEKPLKLDANAILNSPNEFQPLHKVADLDNPLGFKGNYIIFPLLESNILTDFMMTPYFDSIVGLRDPDPLAGWTRYDFSKYVCCLRDELSDEEFNKLRPGLIEAYQQILNSPRTDNEEIIVPTDSLFIEALPGSHPILEDFKLFHRAIDVKKAQAEVRGEEFENLRAAARLLAGEREDPDIEKKVIIEGGETTIVPADDD